LWESKRCWRIDGWCLSRCDAICQTARTAMIEAVLPEPSRKFVMRLGLKIVGRQNLFLLYETYQRLAGYPAVMKLSKSRIGRPPNLRNPKTFNDKVTWLKLHDRSPLLPIIADKVRVRDWVAERVGEEVLIPLVGVYKSAGGIRREELPPRFIAKINFGSESNVMVRDRETLDWKAFTAQLDGWLNRPHYYRLMQWAYHNIPPRIIIEHLIVEGEDEVPDDFKLYVLHGRVEMILHVSGRFSQKHHTYYSRSWTRLEVSTVGNPVKPTDKPENLEEMVDMAERLASGFDLMRVDLYSVGGRIFFGEMTPHPGSGLIAFIPPEFDGQLGALLHVGKES